MYRAGFCLPDHISNECRSISMVSRRARSSLAWSRIAFSFCSESRRSFSQLSMCKSMTSRAKPRYMSSLPLDLYCDPWPSNDRSMNGLLLSSDAFMTSFTPSSFRPIGLSILCLQATCASDPNIPCRFFMPLMYISFSTNILVRSRSIWYSMRDESGPTWSLRKMLLILT